VTSADQGEALLRDLGNAAQTLALYPMDHPRARAALDRIEQSLAAALGGRAELAILFLDNRVVIDGTPLPGGENVARGLARALRARGKERVVVRRGATGIEAQEFIAAISSQQMPESWNGTEHIRLESLRAGVLAADPSSYGKAYGDGDEGFLSAEVGALQSLWQGVAVDGQLQVSLLKDVVHALSMTVTENFGAIIPLAPLKSHDEYTFTHILNVGILAMGLAEGLGLPSRTISDVGVAALLHDVGKSQVPLEILNKPGKLTDGEFTIVKRHPVDGARLLLRTPGAPELAVSVAYEHHVRYDGGGYPALPPGWKTSLASGITQIVDFYDALRTHRPYRRGMPRQRIVSIMREESGRHFNAELLKVFFETVIPREGSEVSELA